MPDEIKSIEELRKAQAAAQAQGTSITNYNMWEQILEDLETAGIKSSGSYEGDLKLHSEMMEAIQAMLEQAQNQQNIQQAAPAQDDKLKVDNKASYDREQDIKANIANATSSSIMADYMKYYHLLG